MITKFLLILFFISISVNAKTYPVSDHYDGNRFFNIVPYVEKTFAEFLKWELTGDHPKWKEVINKPYITPELSSDSKGIVTFINHSTFLIKLSGLTILTDPIFHKRVSPVGFAGPARYREPGISFDKLPNIDVVIISHNHYDHLELETLVKLSKKFNSLIIVPLGDEKLLRSAGVKHVVEMDWWEVTKVKDTAIVFTPTQHWSGRSPMNRFKSLWGGYMITSPKTQVYFGGDTGYSSLFFETKERLGSPDLALLPIGAFKPQDMMGINHMDPDASVMAHIDLGAKSSLGIHFGTFRMGDETMNEAIDELLKAKIKYQVPLDAFKTLDQGESYTIQ